MAHQTLPFIVALPRILLLSRYLFPGWVTQLIR